MSRDKPLIIRADVTPVTIGEIFPSDDLVSQWVFMLSAVVEDLSVADVHLHRALSDDSNGQTMFHYRALIARLYEARRVIQAAARDEIAAFAEGVPELAIQLEFLQKYYSEGESGTSHVDDLYAVMRHRTVHHSFPGSRELTESLEAAAGMEAFYVLDHDEGTSHFVWPELIAIRSLVGDVGDASVADGFRDQVRLASRINVAFTTMLRWAIKAQCERMSIPEDALIRHRGEPPTPPNREARRAARKSRRHK